MAMWAVMDFGGDYTVEGNTITFGPISSTLMCLRRLPVGDQETTTLNMFAESVTFVMDGTLLRLRLRMAVRSLCLHGNLYPYPNEQISQSQR